MAAENKINSAKNESASNSPSGRPGAGSGVKFGKQTVLRNINFAIPRGQTVAVIGESGCGKTVMLKSIIGLVRPTKGSVLFDGNDINQMNDQTLTERQRARFGFVFQNAALFRQPPPLDKTWRFRCGSTANTAKTKSCISCKERLAEVGLPDSVMTKNRRNYRAGCEKRVGIRARPLGYESGTDAVRRTHDRFGPDHERRHQRIDYPHAAFASGYEYSRDARYAHRSQGGRSRGDVLFPFPARIPRNRQIIFDGPPSELDRTKDHRVTQFIQGEAGERLMELRT